jgi:L-threonylcarbamoyladenylate synthase
VTERLASDEAGIERAAALIRAGRLVAFGTETVYGLGADATQELAVAQIFQVKSRPRFNPLICHYPDAVSAFAQGVASEHARALAEAFWPGPLTLVLPRRPGCPVALLVTAGLDAIGVRVPAHPVAAAILRLAGVPVAAPSANCSGRISPTTARHVLDELDGQIDAVLDSGPSAVGLESTVLDLTGWQPTLLRPGGIPREAIEAAIGPIAIDAGNAAAPRAPGQLLSHYAPRLALRMDAYEVGADEALLAFGPQLPGAAATFNLSEAGDLTEAASRLFVGLRELDARGARLGLAGIAAMRVPDHGLGLAINDRLRRAAAPRGG